MNSFVEYVLLEPIASVEEFLKLQFGASSNKCKKYFDKSFLNRSLSSRATLRLPLNFVNDGMINPEYIGPDIKTLYEDDIFLVIDKPANIFVHPLSYEENNNFLSFLRVNRPELLSVNQTQYDRGLLYRLDFETSGVLIYVKNATDHQYLREHFETCAKKKIYYAIVDGQCPLRGKFVHYFSSSEAKGRRVNVSDRLGSGNEQSGELMILGAQELSEGDATLIEIELRTGLRHQIRAQLSHLKFPIRGDEFYAGKSASRLYLHAYKYELNYKEKYYQFNAQPSDFNGK